MRHTLLFLFLFSITAQAEIILRPAVGYTIDKVQSGSSTTTTRQLIDVAAGQRTSGGWLLLGMYSMENKTVQTDTGSSKYNRTSYGVGGGYTSKREERGPYIDAIYHISATYKTDTNKYDGTGWQVDLGYRFNIGSTGIGLQFTYRSFSYTKVDGTKLGTPLQMTNADPMVALIFLF